MRANLVSSPSFVEFSVKVDGGDRGQGNLYFPTPTPLLIF